MVVTHETPVLIIGGGPAGLIAALQLAANGTSCMLVERNPDTTKWPKMDITNCRSMELFKRLDIDKGIREVGVPGNYSFDVLFSSGLSPDGEKIGKWDLPSPDAWRERIRNNNDGSMPREPYQRCSQAIFEAWLKPRILVHPLITTQFGTTFTKLTETDDVVISELVTQNGEIQIVRSEFVIGCDGAGSKVRKNMGIGLTGGPVPMAMHLIHFKSRDLSRLHVQGQFWHIFFTTGVTLISQDEIDTWTMHTLIPITNLDISNIDPIDAIHKGLGTTNTPYPITVDKVLVTSIWRPNICIADRYLSEKCRVFLSGDSAHQNIPTGGYGMNTAVGDSFDIGWKISAVLAGHGGLQLLKSYEAERRPVAIRNIERSGKHMSIHQTYCGWCRETPVNEIKGKINDYISQNQGENKDHGIEMGYRYNGSPVIVSEDPTTETPQNERDYVPETWPGARAPHVFLKDGSTSAFDLFGTGAEYTLVDFTPDTQRGWSRSFQSSAETLGIPLKIVSLPDEKHVRKVWERDAVLVRPDDHVAWRAPSGSKPEDVDVKEILLIAVGKREMKRRDSAIPAVSVSEQGLTSTVGNVDQGIVVGLGEFQR